MGSWDVEVELISVTDGYDESGFPVSDQEQIVSLLANELPVHSANFYGGAQAGFLISNVFEIHTIEYEGQKELRFEGERFRIRRTYKAGRFTELHCERFDIKHN